MRLIILVIWLLPLGLSARQQSPQDSLINTFLAGSEVDSLVDKIYAAHPEFKWELLDGHMESLGLHDTVRFDFLVQLGIVIDTKNPKKAMQIYTTAVDLATVQNDSGRIARAYALVGYNSGTLGNFSGSIKYLFQAMDFIDREKDAETFAEILGNLAMSFLQLGDIDNAIKYQLLSIDQEKKVGDEAGVVISIFNLGLALMELENYDSAVKCYEYAISKAELLNMPKLKAYAYGNLGSIYWSQGKYRAAVDIQQRGLRMERVFHDNVSMADSHAVLGAAYGGLNMRDSMQFHFNRAIELASTQGALDKLLSIYEIQSETYSLIGDYRSAFEALAKARQLGDSLKSVEVNQIKLEIQEKFETEQKEADNQLLTLKNAQNEGEIRRQKYLIAGIGVMMLVVAGIAVYVYRTHKRTQMLNQQISAQAFKLNQLNKTKDRLFSIIGHDLRGPITSFETVTTIIKNYVQKQDLVKIDEMVKHIDESAKQLRQLLDNLLNWSLSQQSELVLNIVPIKLKPIIDEVLEIYGESAAIKEVTFVCELDDEEVLADYHTFATVVRNLISNAVKFSPAGSEIQIGRRKLDGFVELVIKDQGVGIPKESINKLFSIDKSKVRRGTAKEKGTGLGLILVKEFIEMNQGAIRLESEHGKGTTFYITLPKAS